MSELIIVFPLYPGVTHLDFTGPHQVLTRLPGARTIMASAQGGEIEADGITFGRLAKLADVPRCDVICIPGGFGTTDAMNDEVFMNEVKRLADGARYVTSVCTGSLILGAAGLLRGKRAACHWAWRDLLPMFGATIDEARVVQDGNVFTGGGVTAGIDFALTLAAEIAGPEYAQSLQLSYEYAPAPPFNAGRPELAPPQVLAGVRALMDRALEPRRAAAEAAAARLKATA
jgi:putative intracellular protease/amidase